MLHLLRSGCHQRPEGCRVGLLSYFRLIPQSASADASQALATWPPPPNYHAGGKKLCQSLLLRPQVGDMWPVVCWMHSFRFWLERRIRNSSHFCEMNQDMHLLFFPRPRIAGQDTDAHSIWVGRVIKKFWNYIMVAVIQHCKCTACQLICTSESG